MKTSAIFVSDSYTTNFYKNYQHLMQSENPTFNPTNPDAMTFITDELGITVLGGIRLEGLDRLRVTVKIEVLNRRFNNYLNNPETAHLAVRHNLDLYNDTQVEKLIRKCAEKLEVGTSQLSKTISDLINELEKYRLQQIEQQHIKKEIRKSLTHEEKNEAIKFLSQHNLLQITNELIGKSGVIGEENNRLLMYIIFTSRKREHPLHIISLGSSGTGKTYLQEKVSELIPEEDKLEITVLSENAFYYFGQRELKHKLILIEDLDGAENVLYPLRELQSKKKISKTVAHKDTRGNTRTVHLTVEGPVSISGCTTREKLYEDNANRNFLIYPDESTQQDEKIMEYQRRLSAGTINTDAENYIKELFKNCQRLLQPITIKNPFAEQLKIPAEVFKPRRTNSHYLQFIEAVTFYHQYQREQKADEQTGEIFIETTWEDIAEANKLIKEILLRKSDELTGACRNYFEKLKQYLHENTQSTFTNREIRNRLRIPISTVKRYNLELLNNSCIKRNESQKTKSYHYQIINPEDYRQLQQHITTVLDDILNNLNTHQPNGSALAHLQNEPVKPNPRKRKHTPAQQLTETSK